MITRRQMLARILGGSVALAAADIWIPGERSIFLPVRRSIGELWLEYADLVRPVGVLCKLVEKDLGFAPDGMRYEWSVREQPFGVIELMLAPNLSRRGERQMRAALFQPPQYGPWARIADLSSPWVTHWR